MVSEQTFHNAYGEGFVSHALLLGNNTIIPVEDKSTGCNQSLSNVVDGFDSRTSVGFPDMFLSTEHLGTSQPTTNNVYINGQYVTIQEYLKRSRNLYQQETGRITANVQPIFSTSVYADIFKKFGYVFGCNPNATNDDCGKIYKRVSCVGDETHRPYFKHLRCNEPGCPICYPKFAGRIADAVTERITGYRGVFGFDPVYHFVFWDERKEKVKGYPDLKTSFKAAKKRLVLMGAKMAVVWYHPYRMRDEIKEKLRRYKHSRNLAPSTGFWQLAHDDVLELGCLDAYIIPGAHWHAIASGYLENSKVYSAKGFGGYKKVRFLNSEEDIHKTAHYVSTHACREFGKSTVRYFGEISYSKLSRGMPVERIEDIVCEICQKPLQEHYCDDDKNLHGLSKDHLTRLVTTYRYWKRGNKPPGLQETRQKSLWEDKNSDNFEEQCEQARLDRLKMGIT